MSYLEKLQQHQKHETNRLILRAFTHDDAQDIFEYAQDEETVKFLTWPAHTKFEQSVFTIETFYNSPCVFAIETKDTHKCIGCFDLRLDDANEKASFGYVLNKNYWRSGYMSEVLAYMMELCFTKLDVNRLEATYYVGNEGSGAVMKKCGMTEEGRALQEVKIKGQFFDVVHMAKLNPNR